MGVVEGPWGGVMMYGFVGVGGSTSCLNANSTMRTPFAVAAVVACSFVAFFVAPTDGLEVESASRRTLLRVDSRLNVGVLAASPEKVSELLGPPSLTLPSGYDKTTRPYKGARPTGVLVGLKVKRIADLNEKDGVVSFDMIVLTQWRDPRLVDIGYKRILPKDVWTPGLSVANQGKDPEWFASELVLDKRGFLVYERRALITVEHAFELGNFPFDHHEIPVTINAFGYDANEVLMTADLNMTTEHLSDSTWDLQGFVVQATVRKTEMSPKQSLVEGTLYAKRKTPMIVATIILPLVLIVLFTFLAFFVWEKDFGSRITISSIGLLTVMTFMFVLNSQLPRIAYLTWMHWYMSLAFVMTFLVNVHITMVHFLNPSGEANGASDDAPSGQNAPFCTGSDNAQLLSIVQKAAEMNDDQISQQTLKAILQDNGVKAKDELVHGMFQEIDLDQSGTISYEEFKAFINKTDQFADDYDEDDEYAAENNPLLKKRSLVQQKKRLRDSVKRAMDETTTSEDNHLTAEEIMKVSAKAGSPVTLVKAKAWIEQAQVFKGQQHLSFDTFTKLMEKDLEKSQSRFNVMKEMMKFDAFQKMGYTKDNIAKMDKGCRWWLPCLFFMITIFMFILELHNIFYHFHESESWKKLPVKNRPTNLMKDF